MPAPTPIQIRYGPSGLLGMAAAQAGANSVTARNNELQRERDMQFVMGTLAHKQATDEMLMNDALESRKLQLAHALTQTQQQAPQQQGQYYNAGMGDANLKQTYLNSAAPDLDEATQTQLKTLIGNRGVSPDEFRNVIFDATKKQKAKADEDSETTQKREYVRQVSNGMSPQDAASLSAMAEDKKTNIAQIRTAADAIRQRNTVLPRTKLALQAEGLDMQAKTLRVQMEGIAKALGKIGINPESTPPAELNPQYRDPSQGVAGFGARLNDKLNPFSSGTLVSGGADQETMRQYVAYQRMKQQLAAILAQRQQLVTSAVTPQMLGAQPAPAGPTAPAATGGTIDIHSANGFPAAGGNVININGSGRTTPAAAPAQHVGQMSDEELLNALAQ